MWDTDPESSQFFESLRTLHCRVQGLRLCSRLTDLVTWVLYEATERGVLLMDSKSSGGRRAFSLVSICSNLCCSSLVGKNPSPGITATWNGLGVSYKDKIIIISTQVDDNLKKKIFKFIYLKKKNHYAPASQANWCNMTFTVGNLLPSHSCIGWPKSSTVQDLNQGPQHEKWITYQLSYLYPFLKNTIYYCIAFSILVFIGSLCWTFF